MNSKQALENLYQGALNPVNCVYATFRTGASEKITDDYKVVKKDLKVLEHLKKLFCGYKVLEKMGVEYKDMYLLCKNGDDDLIKEWLENDR